MKLRFFYCKHCGKIIAIVKESMIPTICCGQEMEELVANVTDGAMEKHVPLIRVNGNKVTVTVGSKNHPMDEDHYIEWILLQTNNGIQQKWLKPGDLPKYDFAVIEGERIEAAFEYCNIHGLWKGIMEKKYN